MISLIFPAFNEEENLEALCQQLEPVVSQIKGHDVEYVFVDDCSTDRTPELLQQIRKRDKRVKVIRFARNSGSHAAIRSGLHYCHGDCAIVMAADLQDPPEIIERLLVEWKKGFKLIWGVRAQREQETPLTQFFSKSYYRLMNWLTMVRLPPMGADVFLADRMVMNAFKQVPEKHTSVFMTMAWLGFRQSSVDYVKAGRFAGRSKWTLGGKIKLTIDSLLAFSDVPIRYMSVLGFFIAFLGFVYAVYVFWCFVFGSPVQGWSSLMVAILLVGGIQMMMLGVLGEYIWRTFDESRRRPSFVVEYVLE